MCAWGVVAVALVNLGAWWAVAEKWMTFGLAVPAPRSASVLMLLLGSALALRHTWPERRGVEIYGFVVAGLVALAGLSVAYGYFGNRPPRWEGMLGDTSATVAGLPVGHMLLAGSLLFIASAFPFLAFSPSLERRIRLRRAAVVVAALITGLSALNLVSYTAGNPIFTGSQFIMLTVPVSLSFALFNAGLLLSVGSSFWFRKWLFGVDDVTALPQLMRDNRTALRAFALWGAASLAIVVGYLRVQTAIQRDRTDGQLHSLADLKAHEIELWRAERIGDATLIAHTLPLAPGIQAFAVGPGRDRKIADLHQWLGDFERIYGYRRILALNAAMEPLATQWNDPALSVPALRDQLHRPLGNADVIELAPYVGYTGGLRWDLLIPIRPALGAAPVGAILLQTNISETLWPLLHVWPGDNKTGQFVLWYHSGNSLFSLGGLRSEPGPGEAAQRPFGQVRDLTQKNLLLARAANGERGLVEGEDVRGIPVVGLGQWIPRSDWLLSGRVDSSEVYAPVRRDAWQVVALSATIFGLVGMTAARSWRERQRGLLHERMAAELGQKQLANRLDLVMRHANDIIFLTDGDMRFVDANQRAVDIYGWTKEELLQLEIPDLRAPEEEIRLRGIYDRANTPDGTIFETIHRRKDGTRFPVEISARRVEIDGRPNVLSIIRDISDRRRADDALRASEERYRLIADNTSDLIWLYDWAAERFTYASPSALLLLGYRADEMVGRKILDFVTPASKETARRAFEQAQKFVPGTPAQAHLVVELDQERKDGSLVATEVVVSVLSDASGRVTHILGVTRDITERRKAREALETFNTQLEQQVDSRTAELAARNREIEALVDSIPDTVLLCDEQGALVTSHFAQDRVGSLPFAGPGDDARVLHQHPVLLEIARKLHTEAWASQEAVMLEIDRTIDGRDYSIEARATHAGRDRLLILLRDISARKRGERDAQANLERERQLSQMKSQFVSVASHEFRTPLAAAVGSLELLERHASKLTEAKRGELLGRVRNALGRLTNIMNDVLQLSRADSGRVTVKWMNVDLGRFAQDVVNEVADGDRQQHTFTFQQSGSRSTVPADTNLLHHILSNLVGNAARYSPQGTQVSVNLEIAADEFTLTVADQGIGIPEAERERIFEPFVRGSNVGQIGGTGLGLNIVKRYTELMGGRIEVLPTERGAAFRVRVPYTDIKPAQ